MMAATATAVVVVVARLVGEVGGDVGVVGGEVSGVVGGCVLCLMPAYRRSRTDMYRNKFILVLTAIYSIRHGRPCQIKLILFVLIPGLFYVYSSLNLGLNRLDQF